MNPVGCLPGAQRRRPGDIATRYGASPLPAGCGALVPEIKPFPARTVEHTVADNMDRLKPAWNQI